MTVTPIPAPPEPRYLPGGAWWVRRLNILLRFAHDDLALLTNGAWQDLIDQLYFALLGEARDRHRKTRFDETVNRPSVREAQLGLMRAVDPNDIRTDSVDFELAKQTLTIFESEESGFDAQFDSDHFPTNVYMTFMHLLKASKVRRSDFRLCANDKCGYPFVPLRKPREGEKSFCSKKCRNRVAAIEYRKAHTEEVRAKERIRSEKRYAAKVAKKYPKAKVKKKKKK